MTGPAMTTNAWKPSNSPRTPCRKCKVAGQIEYRSAESSCGGFDDYKIRCNACGATWYEEGPDA